MKLILTVIVAILLLVSCSQIHYQERDEYTPNGYDITYETYKSAANAELLKEMALYRAAEISLEYSMPYFEVLSELFTEQLEDYDVPVQKISHPYYLHGDGVSGAPLTNIETVIPAHKRQFIIKRMILEVQLYQDESEDALSATNIISEGEFR
jgi:hypothetical protein